MSRIITDNYIEKLNSIIEEFEISDNHKSLLEFFTKEVAKDQSRKGSRNRKVFSKNDLERINAISESGELRRIFAYINAVIKAFTGQYLHIHINADISDKKIENLISLLSWEALMNCSYDEDLLLEEINNLETSIPKEVRLPGGTEPIPGVRNKNGSLTNQIYKERYGLKHRLRFIKKLKKITKTESHENNGLLLNVNVSAVSSVNLSEFSTFPDSLNLYVNFGNNLRTFFKGIGREKVERLSMVLNLFPSITGKNIWYKDFIRDEISKYSNFKKVITISAGEKTSEQLLEMQKQNRFQAEENYIIFLFEI